MKQRTFAFIFCSPHQRTGTTTAARLLADYFTYEERAFTGFDCDPHEQMFAGFFPANTRVTDIAQIKGQVALFDGMLIADGRPKIVDVWSRAVRTFFETAHTIDFFPETGRHGISPFVFFMADGHESSIDAAWTFHQMNPETGIGVVHVQGAAPLGDAALDHLSQYPPGQRFEIGALDPLVHAQVMQQGFSLSSFLHRPPDSMSIVVRAAVRAWLLNAFQQFRSFELRLMFEDSEFLY